MTYLNPLSFPDQESFEEALLEEGLKQGWKPLPTSDESLEQSDSFEGFLEHYGIKGMKWGIRRERSAAVNVEDKRKRLKTKGGHGLPADPSAVRARVIGQKAKASGIKALSDQELQDYAKRIQMEQNVSRLQYQDSSAPRKFVLSLLGKTGSTMTAEQASSSIVAKQVKRVIKG
jgi:hypothetical protein